MGCGPHLHGHTEDVLGAFNQKSVCISSLNTSVVAVRAASCSGDTGRRLLPAPLGCTKPCRTWTSLLLFLQASLAESCSATAEQ